MKTNKELVVNWHITEACNYRCSYCFAKWQDKKKEVIHSSEDTSKLISEITKIPKILSKQFVFDSIRVNLVGGEPLLYKKQLIHLIEELKAQNINISIITNGSLLDENITIILANNLSSVGYSIDSTNNTTNKLIGRERNDKFLDLDKLQKQINFMKKHNPDIDIKLNTVVSELNYFENFHDIVESINPNKWKVFKMLPILTMDNTITNEKFDGFLRRHNNFKSIIFSENNDEMTNSYLMIDPFGRFFQNLKNSKGYDYSQPIIDVGVEQALSESSFSIKKFQSRY